MMNTGPMQNIGIELSGLAENYWIYKKGDTAL